MDLLKKKIQNCTKCKALVISRRRPVLGEGSVPAKVLFVGLAPGRNGADITGVPFTRDPSGLLFREMLDITKMKNYYVTNIVKCNPKDSEGRNRSPNDQEINNCKIFLDDEILKVSPQFIVPLGKLATEYFWGDINNMRLGILTKKSFGNYTIIPLFHPSYVIRGFYKKNNYLGDFLKLKGIIASKA